LTAHSTRADRDRRRKAKWNRTYYEKNSAKIRAARNARYQNAKRVDGDITK
jgi:hypothetical protein